MTEHPTSHPSRPAPLPAAPPAMSPRGLPETTAHGAADPRNALQRPVGPAPADLPGSALPGSVAAGPPERTGGSGELPAPPGRSGKKRRRQRDRRTADAADHNAAQGAGGHTQAGGPGGEPVGDPARDRGATHGGARSRAEEPDSGSGAHENGGPGGIGRPRDGEGRARQRPQDSAVPPAGPRRGRSTQNGGGTRRQAEEPVRPEAPPARSAHPAEGGEPMPARQPGGDRLRFVGAATRRIARGIDLDEIVLGLCRATVPTFADAILVYLRDPLPVGDERPAGPVVLRLRRTDRIPEEADTNGGRLPTLPAQPDLGPAMGGSAAELAEVVPGGPLAEVLRGVRPLFGEAQAAQAALPELLGTGTRMPPGQRVILAPLRGRRRVIGAAVFLRRPDRPAFEPDDLLVAAQLATHTALGVDKAVLYGREAYIADALQRTMLPDSLPQPTGVRLASRYLPAAETARVGGDWYDAIPLPGSRVALVVGDVMGHSMTSAAIMGQLRTTAQTLAGLDLPPQEVLHHLDEQAQRLGTDRMATCLYAVYDPVAHRIIVANAGHPPPVMLHRGGRAEVLRVPPGAPIGVGGVDFEAVELDAPAGATLVLYTDGLVESRIRDVWTGIEQLRERLTETARLTGPNPPPLEPLCDEVLDMLGPGDRDDDIALLAARFDGIAPSDVAYWYLDPKAQTAGQARRLARRALQRWGLEELTDQVELLVSEVVTNAVRYAERPITLRLLRTDVLRCEVGDDVPQLPRLRQARPSDEGGRGLYLVNRLARRWGATRLSTGKVVWFELSMPPVARRLPGRE
ncbi:SpoIIE family protein phosphatase [Streptomyces sp. NPDC053560]|uniref:SpoIIE family protein phosphatase n=1 Tax=Streptomyces sp. NPDC053560 TaxID=3365711 RepID=UPI0037D78226